MKKILISIGVIILVAIILGAIGSNINDDENKNNINSPLNSIVDENALNQNNITIDYNDASSFENALNSGIKVNGKTVKFEVKNYEPNSAMGINCWAGEHLNFISDNELDVKAGDFVIGRVKEEPTKNFLGSWKIKYDVIEIQNNNQESQVEENAANEKDENQNNNSSEMNSETNQRTYYYYTTNDTETAKKGNTGKYAYIDKSDTYDVYWVIDFDEGYVYNFTDGNEDNTCEKIKIESGNLNDGLKLAYKNSGNAWVKSIHFKYVDSPHQLVVVDNDYFKYEYSTTSLEKALELMKNKTMWES